jgi:23S rRNA (cytidine1920-2'-O)/16S rRNA (cytidine1409-2'-O)-methyltransferase
MFIALSGKKRRLDLALVDSGTFQSRQRARAMIMAGKIFVNDRPVDKPGFFVSTDDHIEIKSKDIPYASRGGLKLEAALNALEINVNGYICLDVGASTGGFTDCLLQKGALRVYAVDVGYGQLAWKLRNDPRIVIIERTNIRHLPSELIPELVHLITIDVSFISLKIVIPAVLRFLKKGAQILALVKPQFEVGKGQVGKGGVVRDSALHDQIIENLTEFSAHIGLSCENTLPSPILGPKGNREIFIHLRSAIH